MVQHRSARQSTRPIPSPGDGDHGLPRDLRPRRLARRLAEVVGLLAVLALVALLAPGLGEVRDRLSDARPGWLALGVAFEVLSGVSYVVLFRRVFCPRMSWRTSSEIGWAELGAGSIVPASGAGGLALGAWVLHRGGMATERIARRSVAFFLLKSSVNFAAVAVLGTLMAVGLLGPHRSLLLTALPAALSVLVIAAALALRGVAPYREADPGVSRVRRGLLAGRRAVAHGTTEALAILRTRDGAVVGGAVGYWAWDNAVLWATFKAIGVDVPLTVILLGYLIGQLGGLLPLPGGVGGIDGGLIGALVVFGAPAAATTAAVLAYRVILFWVPLLGGAAGFWALRRALAHGRRRDLCGPPASA